MDDEDNNKGVRWTPGPWVFNKRAQRIYGGSWSGSCVAQVQINPAWEANARLIAAAPDLYDACGDALELLNEEVLTADKLNTVGRKLQAALAKARGGS